MKINRLRLLGFKSFVDPTELIIERGLTGVVGPNGCGKSNLLEALRWVMGETSHKSMRAAAMDDVIFAGTTGRPQRNSAEVTIFIDNYQRQAPAEFNDRDVIEITRRIEREAGSAYRINGKEARARDVKILFEDAATGARSPALVRQGQIGEIVNAKPEQRRRILEDAAGVAGLHSRRHEAELRLKAAESNLARLSDVLGSLNTQIESLKRQARAARRYKDISGEIRKGEALLFHLSWAEAQGHVEAEEANLSHALESLGAATAAEARALREEAELADTIGPLREEETIRAGVLGRLRIEQENFEREAKRAAERQQELAARADQLEKDIAREQTSVAEAEEVLDRLAMEVEALDRAEDGSEAAELEARARLDEAEASARAAEAALNELTQMAAEWRARRRSLESTCQERKAAATKIERQLATFETETRAVAARAPDVMQLTALQEEGQQLSREIVEIEAATGSAEEQAHALAARAKATREESAKARLALQAVKTERETLAKLLVPSGGGQYPPIVDALSVSPGYETALGAALGDDLDAPVAEDAPVHWRRLEIPIEDGGLPAEAEPLSTHVEGPSEIARRLQQIGVVPSELGHRLQPHLRPGQRLVSKDGDLWRWDGYVAAAHGQTAAAQRLALRNRLAEIERRESQAEEAAELLADAEHVAAEALRTAEADERELRQSWRLRQARLSEARDSLTRVERAARETEAKLAAIADAKSRTEDDLIEAHEKLTEIEAALALLRESDDIEPQLTEAQSKATACRSRVSEARTQLAGIEREHQLRAERAAASKKEQERWGGRSAGALQQIATLNVRLSETKAELDTLADLPALMAEQREKLVSGLQHAERQRQAAADKFAAADTALKAAVQTLRTAQSAVSSARENRARIEAKLEAARARRQEEARRIRETLGIAPDGCLQLAEIVPGTPLPSLVEVDRQLTRLKADRERLGGVNLQADEELARLGEQLATMEQEQADVEQAIAKLRIAIGQLNREAKKRLQEAFDTVNGHFQRLFTTLFMGGEARLEMIESVEDPLEGGLEIIAKPPGKKPATLSLLSGGEQTLTALSLIFAVFLTNPSPICVLDEVDAPLDDANVDRFCTLMEKMASETATRFLVITHHPMTMTRMNRLFGVTMGEKGVSQLVSVDLETAQRFREAG